MSSENSHTPKDSSTPHPHSKDESPANPSIPPEEVFIPNKPPSEEPSKLFLDEPVHSIPLNDERKNSIENNEDIKEKMKETSEKNSRQTINFSNLKGDIENYMKTNREQIIIYILLALGLSLLLFASSLLGALIIGMVAGYYFASEIIYFIRNLGQIMGGQDQLHYVVLATIALGLFIQAPGIFIGAIIVATFKQVLTGPQK